MGGGFAKNEGLERGGTVVKGKRLKGRKWIKCRRSLEEGRE